MREKGMKIPTKPVMTKAMSPPKSQGPRPVKSYCGGKCKCVGWLVQRKAGKRGRTFDWKVNNVNPMKTPSVINL